MHLLLDDSVFWYYWFECTCTYLLIDLFVQCVDGAMWNCGKGVLAACELYRGGCIGGIRSGHTCLRDGKWISHQGHQRSVSRGWGIACWLAFNIFTEFRGVDWRVALCLYLGGGVQILIDKFDWVCLGRGVKGDANELDCIVCMIIRKVCWFPFSGVHQLRMEPE